MVDRPSLSLKLAIFLMRKLFPVPGDTSTAIRELLLSL